VPVFTGNVFVKTDRWTVHKLSLSNCLTYGSETWPVKIEHEVKIHERVGEETKFSAQRIL